MDIFSYIKVTQELWKIIQHGMEHVLNTHFSFLPAVFLLSITKPYIIAKYTEHMITFLWCLLEITNFFFRWTVAYSSYGCMLIKPDTEFSLTLKIFIKYNSAHGLIPPLKIGGISF